MKRYLASARVRTLLLACLSLLFIVGVPAMARFVPAPAIPNVTVLNFEDLPPGTIVTTQYGPRGVIFFNSYIDTHTQAHSGDQVLLSSDPGDEFDTGPLIMEFTSKQ